MIDSPQVFRTLSLTNESMPVLRARVASARASKKKKKKSVHVCETPRLKKGNAFVNVECRHVPKNRLLQ